LNNLKKELLKVLYKKEIMANTSDIKNGLCMMYNGKIVSVVEFQHVKPGK
jgi:hypothetical protein